MNILNLTYTQLLGLFTFGLGVMLCLFAYPNRKPGYEKLRTHSTSSDEELQTKKESHESPESPKKRLRTSSSMEKLNTFFDIEENKQVKLQSRSTQNILNEKEYELKNIYTNFEKYKVTCHICKTLITTDHTLYCYMDNKFCSEDCREHFYKVKNDEYKRRFSL